jgi:hypothetical protein
MVARENLRFCDKDIVTSKARILSTSDRFQAFVGEVISKDKSFKRGSRPDDYYFVNNVL